MPAPKSGFRPTPKAGKGTYQKTSSTTSAPRPRPSKGLKPR